MTYKSYPSSSGAARGRADHSIRPTTPQPVASGPRANALPADADARVFLRTLPGLEEEVALSRDARRAANLQNRPVSSDNEGLFSRPTGTLTAGMPTGAPKPSIAMSTAEETARALAAASGFADDPDAATPIGRETHSDFDPHAIWRMVLAELALQMPAATYDTWVRDTVVLAYEDGEFIIGMPNAYARDWLENRLRNTIKRTLSSLMQRAIQVQFRVYTRTAQDAPQPRATPLYQAASEESVVTSEYTNPTPPPIRPSAPEPVPAAPSAGEAQRAPVSASAPAEDDRRFSAQLNPYHTFDTFVVGNHNRFAHAAALAIVDAPGQSFNPLFIYGGVGLGKTHLLNAIGNSLRQKGYRMIYCSSEQFTNELISSIRNQSTEQFRAKYRQADVLLIDDIQFIGGKESTQEEFFHTFNHLHAAGKQVVLSSDRPPKALPTLDDRLRSRFEGGLQTDIAQPDFETRVAILQTKANRMGVPVPYDVLLLVAERVDSNIRELEGALNRLSMQARLTNQMLSLSLAKSLLENLAPQRLPCPPAGVIKLVAEHFGLRTDDLTGRKRTKEVAYARQIAMYLLREENDLSLPAIGEHLGGRDHSTVRYGVERVAEELDHDESLRMTILTLRDKVYAPPVG